MRIVCQTLILHILSISHIHKNSFLDIYFLITFLLNHIPSTLHQFQIHKMACTFSGVFYVRNVHDKHLDCIFVDECEESHELSIIHYDNHTTRDGPFPEASQYVASGHVYILHGTMTIIDDNYLHPLVLFHLHLPSLHDAYV